MRVSLLLQREPFGEILSKTLRDYWSRASGTPYEVDWLPVGARSASQKGVGQAWLCNAYLNVLFTRDVNPQALDVVRREFAHSVVAWRRPFQAAYVHWATRPNLSKWLSHGGLRVHPCVPDSENTIIVPGNQKIRILNAGTTTSLGLLKHGFPSHGFRREIEFRQQAEAAGLPVPKLLAADAAEGWFREAYLSATPLNRLRNAAAAQSALHQAVNHLRQLVQATGCEIATSVYVDRLVEDAETQLAEIIQLRGEDRDDLVRLVHELRIIALERAPVTSISTSLTHGDFQPANIMTNEQGVWLIDWEFADRRQSIFDLCVYTFASRFPRGLAERLWQYVQQGPPADTVLHTAWPGMGSAISEVDDPLRLTQTAVFLHCCRVLRTAFRPGEFR